MGDESDPTDPDTLRADVVRHRKRAAQIQELIPDQVTVSFFSINTKAIRDNLCEKHLKIAREEIEIIARQAIVQANQIMLDIDNMDIAIMAVPTNIEELSQIRQLMVQVPIDLEKKGVDIKKCTDIYDMLNDFQYAFTEEEDADKRWRMFGSPQETMQKIARQNVFLDKEKEKFVAQM